MISCPRKFVLQVVCILIKGLMLLCACRCMWVFWEAGGLNDLLSFNPAENAWAVMPSNGVAPSARYGFGFAATPERKLYVFGGDGTRGEPAPYGRGLLGRRPLPLARFLDFESGFTCRFPCIGSPHDCIEWHLNAPYPCGQSPLNRTLINRCPSPTAFHRQTATKMQGNKLLASLQFQSCPHLLKAAPRVRARARAHTHTPVKHTHTKNPSNCLFYIPSAYAVSFTHSHLQCRQLRS